MGYTEYFAKRFYSFDGEEIARIRVKFENYKNTLLWSTTQLEGFVLGKWLPLIRYDFDPKDKIPVHINKEYTSTDDKLNKSEFKCHSALLIIKATRLLLALNDSQILELTEKRKNVFLKEGK